MNLAQGGHLLFCNLLLMFLCLKVNVTVELSYSFKNLKRIIIVLYQEVDIIYQSLLFSEKLFQLIFKQGNRHTKYFK